MSHDLVQTITFPSNAPIKTVQLNTGLFINNEFVEGVEKRVFASLSPSTGQRIVDVCEAREKDVDIAVRAARKAYETSWGTKVPGHVRGKMLMDLAAKIEENIDELAALEALDNGKAFQIAKGFDVAQAAANLRYMGGLADKALTGKTIEVDDSKLAMTLHEPIGVCGQIVPWNFPILMFSWKLGPALACGNTIVLKTAEQTPLAALKICEYIAGIFPPGVVNVLSGDGPNCGKYIAQHMDVDKVAFTGSTLVGREILKAAASSNLKKTTLELGGKSPNIIFEDADIEQAVKWASFGIMFNTGQCCCAGSRVYVQSSIYDDFVKRLVEQVKTIKTGEPFDAESFLGPQTSQRQLDTVTRFIESGKKSGAKILTGGQRMGDKGYFMEPTIFTDAGHNTEIVSQEIFGPVVVVTKFDDEESLIKVANDTVYGLAAAVFSQNVSRCMRVAQRLQAGTVWVNCYNQLNPQVPFGGFKTSGIGRELGTDALANYVQIKSVHINLSQPAP